MAIVNNSINSETKLSPYDKEFINEMMDRLTIFGQLPYKIPEKMIVSVIKNSAKFFYDYDYRALRQSYYHINVTDIPKTQKVNNFVEVVLKLNNRVRVVKDIYDATTQANFDLSSAMYLSASVGGASGMFQSSIDNNLTILEGATKMIERRSLDMTFGSNIPFEYVNATKELILQAQPENNIILDVMCFLEVKDLYEIKNFYDYVLSKCRGELRRLIGSHEIQLPGGAKLSVDDVCNGDSDWKEIESVVKASNGMGDIILRRK